MSSRLEKLQKALVEKNLDGLLVRTFESSNQNVLYLSGFGGTTAVLLITQNEAFIVTDGRYWSRVALEAPYLTLVKHQPRKKISEGINQAIEQAGLTSAAKIGFEEAHLSVQVFKAWEKEIQANLVPTAHLVERFRQMKDAAEIAALREGCRSTSRVYEEVAALIRPGLTETEVAFEIEMRLRKHGATGNSFPAIVASGPNAAIPHHATGSRKLEAGECVIMDFGGTYAGGYCSDITRTVFVPGKAPDPKLVEIYNIVLEANQAAFKALKKGIMNADYDKVARDHIAARGYGEFFTHGLGHSLGLAAHDPYDYLHDPFDVGTVFTNEPGIYIEGLGGVRIEDDDVVTNDGAERLTDAPYWEF